jgi:hypothetical protein
MSTDLLKQIDDLVASKTFNLDALDGIKKLKDDLTTTLEERDVFKRRCTDLGEANKRQSEAIQERDYRIEQLTKDLQTSEAYRAKAREDIYEAEKHKAVAEAWKEAMQTVFKPSSVRETMWQSIPVSQSYNGNTMVSTYQQETKTTKEEL